MRDGPSTLREASGATGSGTLYPKRPETAEGPESNQQIEDLTQLNN